MSDAPNPAPAKAATPPPGQNSALTRLARQQEATQIFEAAVIMRRLGYASCAHLMRAVAGRHLEGES